MAFLLKTTSLQEKERERAKISEAEPADRSLDLAKSTLEDLLIQE